MQLVDPPHHGRSSAPVTGRDDVPERSDCSGALCRSPAMSPLLNHRAFGRLSSGPVTGADDLAMMRRIDELHLEVPFYARGAWCSNSTRQATASTQARAKADARDGDRGAGPAAPAPAKPRPATRSIPICCAA